MAIKKTNKPVAKGVDFKKASAKKAEGKSSLAHLFDDTDMSEASNMLPEGEHEVRLNSFEIKDKPGKGTSAFVEYEAIDGDYEGKKVRQMYMLTEPNGEKKQGMAYLKRDLALLGYEDVKGKDLESSLQTLTEEQPICIINVKNNGQYVNAYLQGLAENVATGDDTKTEEAAPEIEIGTKVQFDSDGDTVTGTVLRIKADSIRVKGDDGEIYNTTLDELEIFTEEDNAEEAEAETEIAVGSQVTFDDDGDEKSGEVIKIKGDVATVKDEDGDKYEVDLGDLTLAATGSLNLAEAEIEVGSRVTWDDDGTDMEGEVTAIKGTKATIKDDDDDKHKIELEDLTLAD